MIFMNYLLATTKDIQFRECSMKVSGTKLLEKNLPKAFQAITLEELESMIKELIEINKIFLSSFIRNLSVGM